MQIGLGIGIPFSKSQVWLAVQSFSPSNLFQDGTQGFWLDPSDLSTMFQDAAGTTPVTAVEQPVGLIFDKSKGLVLGPELVTNGDFSGGVFTPWDGHGATLSIDTNRLKVVGFPGQGASQVIPIKANTFYKLTIDIISSSNDWNVLLGSGWGLAEYYNAGRQSGSKSISIYIYSTATANAMLQFYMYGANQTAIIDNISVRELPGNHAYQTVSTKRPVLSARVNLLTKSDSLGPGDGWATSPGVWTGTYTIAPNGTNTAMSIKNVAATVNQYFYLKSVTAATYRMSVYAKANTGSSIDIFEYYTNGFTPNRVRFVLTGSGSITNNALGFSCGIVSQSNGWYYCFVDIPVTTGTREFDFVPSVVDTEVYLWGASLVPANQASLPYQRVNTSTDHDSDPTKFPWYLKFNGVNQWLQTASIDFTSTDKMTVFAGVRKIGTSIAVPIELSANADTTSGTFNVGAPVAPDTYYTSLRGSSTLSAKQTLANFASPVTSVVQASYALSQPSATDMSVRVNGDHQTLSVASGSPGPAGVGAFGNYPLYIGARAGSSLFFNGHLYQLVIVGKQASPTEITDTEQYVNSKTLAY